MRIGVIGTGAIGGYYGARLQCAGHELHYLIRSDYAHVVEHGLIIDSCAGDMRLPQVNAHAHMAHMPACDLLIIACKTTANAHIFPHIAPLLTDNGSVLLLQNGIGEEEHIRQYISHPLLSGLCFICAQKIQPGHIHHSDYGLMTIGHWLDDRSAAGTTDALSHLQHTLESAQLEVTVAEDLLQARWKKLLWNVPFNALSVLLDAHTDALLANPSCAELVRILMTEVQTIAAADNRILPDKMIDAMIHNTEKMVPYATSMKVDADQNRPLEIDSILGAPLAYAKQAKLSTPALASMYAQLHFLYGNSAQTHV